LLKDFDIWTIARRVSPIQLSALCIGTAVVLAVAVSHLFWFLYCGSVPDGLTLVAGGAAFLVSLPMVELFVRSVYRLQATNLRLLNTKTKLNFNIDELATARDELAQLNLQLEERVAERTSELQAALQEAEYANASKSVFLANMSHELRTPLNGIIGYAEIIVNRAEIFRNIPEEKLDEYARAIFASGHHLNSMVNDLLDLSKIEFEQYSVKREPIAVDAFVHEVVAELVPTATARDQDIVIELPDDPFTFAGDRRAAHQILTNLLSNALKYSSAGQPVTIAAEVSDEMTSFIVTDHGIGMSADAIAKATEPFSRFSDAHIASGESIGLGLSIVQKLCKLLDGRLTLDSVEGAGTKARVDFAVEAERTDDAPSPVLALAS